MLTDLEYFSVQDVMDVATTASPLLMFELLLCYDQYNESRKKSPGGGGHQSDRNLVGDRSLR